MKITHILALVTSLAITATAAPPSNSNDNQMQALRKAVEDAYSSTQAATNDADYRLRNTCYHHLIQTNFPQIFDLARQNPASETAFEMFSWMVMKGAFERGPVLTNRLQAVGQLAQYQSANSGVGPLCGFLGHDWVWRWRERPVVDFLQAVIKNNPDRANRAQAIFSLGSLNACKAENLAEFEQWRKVPFYAAYVATYETTDLTQWGDSKSTAAEAERQLEGVMTNYADCRDLRPRGSKKPLLLKTEEESELHELLYLSLGKSALEIEAESIDGRKFKLSDSRGKITVLIFWASWCGPCMQLVPVERALAERMKGKPFTIIGVNGDGLLPDARRAVAHEKMTWPSFWNGPDGANGPITSTWDVSGWPIVYELDADGTIRFKFEGYGPSTSNILNGSVDELLKELASHQK